VVISNIKSSQPKWRSTQQWPLRPQNMEEVEQNINPLQAHLLTSNLDEISAIVLDPGYSTTRAGFAGEDVPKSVIPTHYGVLPSDSGPKYLFGDNAINMPLPGLEIENPMSKDGTVDDWDTATKVWEYAITSRLTNNKPGDPRMNGLNDPDDEEMNGGMDGLDDEERPVVENPLLMTETGWNPTRAREKSIEIAMESFGTPAFWLAKNGVLSA
jgi:actin-related protein 4